MGKTQEPQPFSRTVRIGMISVVPEEEEEDINMESYGRMDMNMNITGNIRKPKERKHTP